MAAAADGNARRVIDIVDVAVRWVELAVSIMLALVAVAGAVYLGLQLVRTGENPGTAALESLFSAILLVFILLELYRIGTAFVKGEDVINRVFEVGLVALVRQVIVAEFVHLPVVTELVFAALIVALGVAWFLSTLAMRTRPEAPPVTSEGTTEPAEESAR